MVSFRYKHFMRERNALSLTGDETLLSVSEYFGVKPRREVYGDEAAEGRAASLEGYRIVKRDDFVMNYMLAWKGAYGISAYNGIVSPAYSVFEVDTDQVNLRYLHHLTRSEQTKEYFRSMSKGIIDSRLRLYPETLLSANIELPDLETQKEIADFLDAETTRIDALIEKKKAFLSLVEAKFIATQEEVFAKGISGNTHQQASVYPWAPPLPAGWRQIPVRQILQRVKRPVGENYSKFELLSLSKNGVIPRDIDSGKGKFPSDFSSYQEVQPNELVFCLFDMDETPRTVGLAKISGMITGAYDVMAVSNLAIPEYVYMYFLCLDNSKALKPFYTGLRKVVRMPTFLSIRIPLPSIEEQKEIVSFLSKLSASTETIRDRKKRSLSLLHEYKAALITAAVTGEIDVKEYKKAGQAERQLDHIHQEAEQ